MTEPLDAACRRARAALDVSPEGALRLGMRQMVWAAVGARAVPADIAGDGYQRRAALAIACATHVAAIWDRTFADDDLSRRAIATAQAVASGTQSRSVGQAAFDGLWNALLQRASEAPVPDIAAGFAAVQALGTALADEDFDVADLAAGRPDSDDPEMGDAAYYAAAAQAGGLAEDEASSSSLRRSFWEWWLDQVVRQPA